MSWSRGRRAATAGVAAVLVSGGALLAYDASGRLPGGVFPDAVPSPHRSSAQPVSPAPGPTAGAVLSAPTQGRGPTAAGIAAVLAPLLADPRLGGRIGALVLDAATGDRLYARSDAESLIPASLAKLVTATAALSTIGPQTRFRTRVLEVAAGELVLVGGGDPMLSAGQPAAAGSATPASLRTLAASTATALAARHEQPLEQIHLAVDDALFAGPAAAAQWPRSYLTSGTVARVSALSVDEARLRPHRDARAPDPALAAGMAFADLLRARGFPVATTVTRTSAPATAAVLATVLSPPLSDIVEQMLQFSDNDVAEALLRQVAIARHLPATFAGGASAVLGELARLGIDTHGVVLVDGSGLSRVDRVPARTVAAVLVQAAAPRSALLRPVLTGLPVAGFTGTLATRFATAVTRRAAGLVRAKTGTLTGVSALAGTVQVRGHLLVFAVLANDVPGSVAAARERLDRVAAALASCGCG